MEKFSRWPALTSLPWQRRRRWGSPQLHEGLSTWHAIKGWIISWLAIGGKLDDRIWKPQSEGTQGCSRYPWENEHIIYHPRKGLRIRARTKKDKRRTLFCEKPLRTEEKLAPTSLVTAMATGSSSTFISRLVCSNFPPRMFKRCEIVCLFHANSCRL